jgi:hypothetical protein
LIGNEKSFLLTYGYTQEPILFPLEISEQHATLFGVEAGPLTSQKLMSIFQNEKGNGLLQIISDGTKVPGDERLGRNFFDKLAALWTILVPDKNLRTQIVSREKKYKRLLVLPDGPLAKFPFEMLVVNSNFAEPLYLLDQGPATLYSPSAGMYHFLSGRSPSQNKDVLTVGNPNYTSSKAKPNEGDTLIATRGESFSNRFGQLLPLPKSSEETKWIEDSCHAKNIPVVRLDKATSTEKNVRDNVKQKRIVHLSCHGLSDDYYKVNKMAFTKM